jgi:hypothetical protein
VPITINFLSESDCLQAHFWAANAAQKPGFPLQFLGSAYALPVGFPLQSLAQHTLKKQFITKSKKSKEKTPPGADSACAGLGASVHACSFATHLLEHVSIRTAGRYSYRPPLRVSQTFRVDSPADEPRQDIKRRNIRFTAIFSM